MPDSNDKTNKSVQQNNMFPALQKGWENAIGQAGNLYNQNIGKPPQLAPLNGYSQEGLNATANIARNGIPGFAEGQQFNTNMIAGNGMTPDMVKTAGYLTPFADGSMQEDPRLQQMLDTNANRAANAGATRFGGGRYGSAAIGQGIGQAVSDANNATMLQSNENARNRQLQASGLLGQMYEAGAGRAMQATAMLPTLNNLQYDGASRLAGVGDFYQGRAQTNADYARNYKNDALSYYAGILGGMGNLGGTTVTTTPKQSPSLAQGILGGAAMGAGIGSKIPGIGGGWGALGGGILGLWA